VSVDRRKKWASVRMASITTPGGGLGGSDRREHAGSHRYARPMGNPYSRPPAATAYRFEGLSQIGPAGYAKFVEGAQQSALCRPD